MGRAAVLEFWRAVLARYDTNTIESLSLQESAPGRFVRRAHLHHYSTATGQILDYTVTPAPK